MPKAGVLLSSGAPASGWLQSLTISNTATLIFTNWDTTLSATNVTISTNATVTCAGPFTNDVMSNRVYVVCSNLTLCAGGRIDVDSAGHYRGETNLAHVNGYGPGAGIGDGGAAHGGFGGKGGSSSAGQPKPVGDPRAPVLPGSGGGGAGYGGTGGHGGGAVRIDASGKVTVNGTISANGGNAVSQSGGGSGGSIYITCQTIAGTNGVVRANGGIGQSHGAWGAGGRIAVGYSASAQSYEPLPLINFSVRPVSSPGAYGAADIGTVYFPDTSLLAEPFNVDGQIILDVPAWTTDRLTISNRWVRFPQDGFQLTVSNNLVLVRGGSATQLEMGGSFLTNFPISTYTTMNGYPGNGFRFFSRTSPPVLRVGGNLILSNAACLYLFNAETNGATPEYGSLVDVTGNMVVGTGCWVIAQSHWTNGGSSLFRMRSLTVATNAGFNADDGGYGITLGNGYGPGGGGGVYPCSGGSYGGLGGGATADKTYGSSNAPVFPGSGSGHSSFSISQGFGGGLVRIEASATIIFGGTITANGGAGSYAGSAGSGGGIYLCCKKFIGNAAGMLLANGGAQNYSGYKGGGGGRIAVWRMLDESSGAVSNAAAGGTGASPGQDGTIVWGWLPAKGTVILIR